MCDFHWLDSALSSIQFFDSVDRVTGRTLRQDTLRNASVTRTALFAGYCYWREDQPVKHLVLREGRAGRMLRGQTNRMM